MRKVLVGIAGAAAVVAVVGQTSAGAAPAGPAFGAPVLLTIDKYAGGYEP